MDPRSSNELTLLASCSPGRLTSVVNSSDFSSSTTVNSKEPETYPSAAPCKITDRSPSARSLLMASMLVIDVLDASAMTTESRCCTSPCGSPVNTTDNSLLGSSRLRCTSKEACPSFSLRICGAIESVSSATSLSVTTNANSVCGNPSALAVRVTERSPSTSSSRKIGRGTLIELAPAGILMKPGDVNSVSSLLLTMTSNSLVTSYVFLSIIIWGIGSDETIAT